MDYRLIAEEFVKLQKGFGVNTVSVRLGTITLEQEKELVEQIGSEPSVMSEFSWETTKTIDYVDGFYFSYAIPNTKEAHIQKLERELAKLKGEVVNA